MKYVLLHKVFSVALSTLVLLSTFSFTIEKHYCGDRLVDVALFSEVDGCGMEMDKLPDLKKSCCKNEVDLIEGQDEITIKAFDDLEDIQQQVLFAYIYSYFNLYESLPKKVIPHKDYSPPLLISDIQVLNETYLI
ncbi:MAG: hypothetical protein ED556_11015 [Winogradskyella sp.]|uniref:HYC_CC_PP family protein n=1 Tax=Winogradskyella sp. TaxID=1883156 RepID=UPI000F418CBB|nr:hypothetical protein [Winogradskyella sp.]RNC85088.1 MAG: hypothetical protein ED556_11015 [Winogradskyella sp.]